MGIVLWQKNPKMERERTPLTYSTVYGSPLAPFSVKGPTTCLDLAREGSLRPLSGSSPLFSSPLTLLIWQLTSQVSHFVVFHWDYVYTRISRIRNVLVQDSFYRLHTKHESGFKTFRFRHESGNFRIRNLKWKHCIRIPTNPNFPVV